jgi:hypothetical protein
MLAKHPNPSVAELTGVFLDLQKLTPVTRRFWFLCCFSQRDERQKYIKIILGVLK